MHQSCSISKLEWLRYCPTTLACINLKTNITYFPDPEPRVQHTPNLIKPLPDDASISTFRGLYVSCSSGLLHMRPWKQREHPALPFDRLIDPSKTLITTIWLVCKIFSCTLVLIQLWDNYKSVINLKCSQHLIEAQIISVAVLGNYSTTEL